MKATKEARDVLAIIAELGCYDDAHHKQWVLDQVVRYLTGESYDEWVEGVEAVDGPFGYKWQRGIRP